MQLKFTNASQISETIPKDQLIIVLNDTSMFMTVASRILGAAAIHRDRLCWPSFLICQLSFQSQFMKPSLNVRGGELEN